MMKTIRTKASVPTSTGQSLLVHLTLHVDDKKNVVVAADVIGVADENDYKLPTSRQWQQQHPQAA